MLFLVTGGTGYIGSHTVVELLQDGNNVVIVDNLSNSKKSVLDGITKITGAKISQGFNKLSENFFYSFDISNSIKLKELFSRHKIDAVLHFAGDKSVNESTDKPIKYYQNGVSNSLVLISEMLEANVKTLIFSSSATVYGEVASVPVSENDPVGSCLNPYGRTKFFIEEILKDVAFKYTDFRIGILRYFNPVGAHPSSLIGEDPSGLPGNIMPIIVKVASKEIRQLMIYGNDYDTIDGTGVRDYIHVVDVSRGHIATLRYLLLKTSGDFLTLNLGTGNGYSVLELVKEFENISGIKIPYKFSSRRKGDISECWASVEKAKKTIHWKAERNLSEMCLDAWNWEKSNY